jgi:uncharacterized membrane protein YfcA
LTEIFLFSMAVLGGALNAVAGGGSFLALPALLSVGVPAVSANATTTFALWPGSVSSAVAYRREIVAAKKWLIALGIISVVGGLIGGWLLVRTSDTRFLRLLPWLMLAAAVTFTFGADVVGRIRAARRPRSPAPADADAFTIPLWIFPFQFVVATYGGYFGGGIGIMMLAGLAVAGMTDIHEMNGLKALLAVAINGVALAEFVLSGAIAWTPGLIMVAGGIVGGYAGAAFARRLPPRAIRAFVIVVAWAMTVYFFVTS